METFKVGTLVALAFASGGGLSAYVMSAQRADEPAPRPSYKSTLMDEASGISVSESAGTSDAPQAPLPADAAHLADIEPSEDEGRSAGEILWALEQAYRDQEHRIRLLEAALDESAALEESAPVEEASTEEDATSNEVPFELAEAVADDVPVPGPDSSSPVPDPAPLPPESTGVALLDELPEQELPEQELPKTAALSTPAPVIVVNHYQPIYLASQPGTQAPDQRALRRSRKPAAESSPGSLALHPTQSWVASGFDVYTKR